MLDLDAWSERAAIMEFDGGLSRFKAETLAAEAQGATRWQMLEAFNAQRERDFARGGYQRSAVDRKRGADNVSRMQRASEEETGRVSQRDTQAGRDRLELLALRA